MTGCKAQTIDNIQFVSVKNNIDLKVIFGDVDGAIIYKPQIIEIKNNYKSQLTLEALHYSKTGSPVFGEEGRFIIMANSDSSLGNIASNIKIPSNKTNQIFIYIGYKIKLSPNEKQNIISQSELIGTHLGRHVYSVPTNYDMNNLYYSKIHYTLGYIFSYCYTERKNNILPLKIPITF